MCVFFLCKVWRPTRSNRTNTLLPDTTLVRSSRMGSDGIGGTKIWGKGESGTYYYYAHLSAFAEGMHDGKRVEPGEVIGFVGDTGNGRGGPPHLHFQIHPDGGAPVNPYPLLKVVDDLSRAAKARMAG